MNIELQVENIKCGGCASSIRKGLLADKRISEVDIDVELGKVCVQALVEQDESIRAELASMLLKMGYPESGTAEGIKAAAAKAKSFVSCAIGKVDNMVNK